MTFFRLLPATARLLFVTSCRPLAIPFCLLTLVVAFHWQGATAARAQAQPPDPAGDTRLGLRVELDAADNRMRSHLERADQFLGDGQWAEAIEVVRRVMEEDGGKVILIPHDSPGVDEFARYVPLREYCQMWLVALHRSTPQALAHYRSQVDPAAARQFAQAAAARDAAALQRIVDQYFASSYGDNALYALGELALERGEPTFARCCWERINPLLRCLPFADQGVLAVDGYPLWLALHDVDPAKHWEAVEPLLTGERVNRNWLAYPDSEIDLADIRARLVLASILEGSPRRASRELDVLRGLHPGATGTIAGRTAPYAELLGELLVQSESWPPIPRPDEWRTFAGAPERFQTAPREIDIGRRVVWSYPLPPMIRPADLGQRNGRVLEDDAGLLSYFPLILRGEVLVGTYAGIAAVDLHSGRTKWFAQASTAAGDETAARPVPWHEPAVGVPRFTLTADGHKLFARLGSPVTGTRRLGEVVASQRGYLAAIDLDAQGKLLFDPIRLDGQQWQAPGWSFDGVPLTDGENLFCALRRRSAVGAEAHVACFSARNGKLRWRQMICASDAAGGDSGDEITHNLLSLAEGTLYFNSNLGVVAALGEADGKIRWAVRYPRGGWNPADPVGNPRRIRDLNPCVVYKDFVIVAPADCERMMALDASTGHLLWATSRQALSDVTHLLGVAEGNLIASGNCLYWINVETGRIVGQFPPGNRDTLKGFGRGLLAGRSVYWPTRDEIYVFSPEGPRQLRQPIDLGQLGVSGGNLVSAEGVLIIATADRLVAFNRHGRKMPEGR